MAAQKAADDERAGKYPLPAGATPSQVSDLGFLLQRIPVLLQAQLDLLGEIEAARAKRAVDEDALARWKGFDEPGPYSLTQLDRLLDQLDAERTRLHSFESVGSLNVEEVTRVEARLKSTQADERLALEKATDGVVAPLELARLRTRRVTEIRSLLLLQGELNAELMHASRARAQLLERQAAAMSANFRFNEQEFEKILKNLQAQQLALDRRIEETSAARSRTLAERDQLQKAIDSQPTPKSVDEVRRRAEQQARLDGANVTLEALRTQQSALSTLRGIAPISVDAWSQRYASLSSPDPEKRRVAEKSLATLLTRVDSLKSYATDLAAVADAAVKDQQRRVDALDENAPGRRYALAALEATKRAADAAGEVQALGQQLATAQKRWRQEFADAAQQRSTSEKAAVVWAEAKDLGREVWDFELFAVEDTVDIGGKPTTVSRGVTVGKSIGALLLFIIGYKIAGFFALRAQRIMVERFAVDAAQARVLRRWMMLLTGFVLAVITLNLARIPLTVFRLHGRRAGHRRRLRNADAAAQPHQRGHRAVRTQGPRRRHRGRRRRAGRRHGARHPLDHGAAVRWHRDDGPELAAARTEGHQLDRGVADHAPGRQGRRGLRLTHAAGGGHHEGGCRRARPRAQGAGTLRDLRGLRRQRAGLRALLLGRPGQVQRHAGAKRPALHAREALRGRRDLHRVSATGHPPRCRAAAAGRGRWQFSTGAGVLMYDEADREFMSRALALATRALYDAEPNPRVGCVIVREGRVIGEGWTQAPGSNHAEVEALLDARRNGHDVRGATVYVSLEPCSHFGRTPPCATALIEAHVGRVIAAVEDPNPLVAGGGLEMLRSAGVDVRCGLLEQEAAEINLGFFSRMQRGRPWVRMKIAASLDGKTALENGVSKWITSESARRDGHAWRARAGAVLTGIGTVRADNPQLNVRLVETRRQPLRVLVDSRLEVDPGARVFEGEGNVLVATAVSAPAREIALRARGAEVIALPNESGKVDLAALMKELAHRHINEVHVEAGFRLNGSLVQAGVVDELLVYLAPLLMGEAQGMVHLPALSDLTHAQRLEFREVTAVGEDVRILARLHP